MLSGMECRLLRCDEDIHSVKSFCLYAWVCACVWLILFIARLRLFIELGLFFFNWIMCCNISNRNGERRYEQDDGERSAA